VGNGFWRRKRGISPEIRHMYAVDTQLVSHRRMEHFELRYPFPSLHLYKLLSSC
jgi:hypothetical protein